MKVNEEWAEVGSRLKRAARESGLSILELGTSLGVQRPTIYAYVSGTLKIPVKRLHAAAKITGKPISYFDPQHVEDLDDSSKTKSNIDLIHALLNPPDPKSASEAALKVLQGSPEAKRDGIRSEVLRSAGLALAIKGDFLQASESLSEARELFVQTGEPLKAASASQTLGVCQINLGQIEKACESFEFALAHFPAETRWKAQVALAALAERTGEFARAKSLLSSLLDDATLSDEALAYARANFASILAVRGKWKSATSHAEIALEAAYAAKLTDQVCEMLMILAEAMASTGDICQAKSFALRAGDVAFSLQDGARGNIANLVMGKINLREGDIEECRLRAVKAQARAMQSGYKRSEALALLLLSLAALATGDFATTRDYAILAHTQAVKNRYPVSAVSAQTLVALGCLGLGDAARALDDATEASSQATEMDLGLQAAEAQFVLALCLEANGKHNENQAAMALAEQGFAEHGGNSLLKQIFVKSSENAVQYDVR